LVDEDPRVTRGKELGRWLGFTILFEALGFGLAFAAGNLLHGIWMRASGAGLDEDMPLALTLAISIAVGGAEGLSLGTGQWLVLRHRFGDLRWGAWAGATAIGGGLAWALGMSLGGRLGHPPPMWLMALLLLASGLVFGAILGAAQWVVLRRHARRSLRWVAANAAGWTVGLLATYVAVAVIDESTDTPVVVLISLAAGAIMAIAPALITGITLRGLEPR
jgi:hypothetical protein